MTAARAERTKTPLGERLDDFSAQLTTVIAAICAFVWLASIPKFSAPAFPTTAHGALHTAEALAGP